MDTVSLLKNPTSGPRILFFSGGSALRQTSRELARYTHNSIHIITSFDSGGSSAVLRKAFHMPAIGDIRNRLMSLADRESQENPAIYDLFAHRLPVDEKAADLHAEFQAIAAGRHRLSAVIGEPMRSTICFYLYRFQEHMPANFDLRGASIGNLVLAGGYLACEQNLEPALVLFSALVQVRGIVRPVTNRHLHLVAELADGHRVVGQHRITGKEHKKLQVPIARIYLTDSQQQPDPVAVPIEPDIAELIARAQLICFPMGSFYSSVLANLLPTGVCQAVTANPCPKVFIPSTGNDPEAIGMSVADQVRILADTIANGGVGDTADRRMLDFLILDGNHHRYIHGVDEAALEAYDLQIVTGDLTGPGACAHLAADRLVPLLLSLI